ncbi:LicD family protein [Pontibacter kalidii]|uniref:LicD family protein n=1 Tax=Pontibacter kalidii TaxID=2592049 RepID=UPI002259C7A4|nr:LicD family protein [Pontibacter kalidii]
MNFEHLIPDEREKGETRIEQCHLVLLRMFKIFDLLCRKHQIQYFLCSGTLKAAVIYKGFKPWDDDLDVGMTRENYEKFVQHAVPELPGDIFFQTPETDAFFPDCHRVEAKLRDKYSSYNMPESMQQVKWHCGLMLDILVFDKAFLPHNFFIYLQNRLLIFFLQRNGNKARARVLRWITQHTPIPLVYASSFINSRQMVKLGANYFKEEEISELVEIEFKGVSTYIPKGWHRYLTRRYGNYLQPPPPEKQKGHHSIGIPDPFTPCHHTEVLHWKDRQQAHVVVEPIKV